MHCQLPCIAKHVLYSCLRTLKYRTLVHLSFTNTIQTLRILKPLCHPAPGHSCRDAALFPNYFGHTCCNMVEWFWCDSSLILTTNWSPSVLWHCWFGHLSSKNRPRNDLLCVEWDVKPYTLTHSLTLINAALTEWDNSAVNGYSAPTVTMA